MACRGGAPQPVLHAPLLLLLLRLLAVSFPLVTNAARSRHILSTNLTQPTSSTANDASFTTVQLEHNSLNFTNNRTELVPVPFYFYTPQPALTAHANTSGDELPAILLLNGAYVESKWYSSLAKQLSQSGLWVAASDYRREVPGLQPNDKPGCATPRVQPSARLINTVMQGGVVQGQDDSEPVRSAVEGFRATAMEHGLLLLGHSWGGHLAALTLGDAHCPSNSAANGPNWNISYCEYYQPILDSGGSNILKGGLLFEGGSNASVNMAQPNSSILYLAGKYYDKPKAAFDGDNKTTCAAYVRLGSNHFGLVDFVPGVDGRQVTPCNTDQPPAVADGYRVAEPQQAQLVRTVGDAVQGFIKWRFSSSQQQRQDAAATFLELPSRSEVLEVVVKPGCGA